MLGAEPGANEFPRRTGRGHKTDWAIANLIRENKIPQIKTAIQTSAEEGMFTMDQNIKKMFGDGLITEETALAYMTNPADLK